MGARHTAIVFHTVEGHTNDVAERIAARFQAAGNDVQVFQLPDSPDLTKFDAVLVGGSIHMGKHHKELVTFVRAYRDAITARPNGFFSVSMTAITQDEQHAAQAQGYVDLFREETGWNPGMVALVGGALQYTRYGHLKRWMVRKIVGASGEGLGTDTHRNYDYTDYGALDAFADDFLAHAGVGAGG